MTCHSCDQGICSAIDDEIIKRLNSVLFYTENDPGKLCDGHGHTLTVPVWTWIVLAALSCVVQSLLPALPPLSYSVAIESHPSSGTCIGSGTHRPEPLRSNDGLKMSCVSDDGGPHLRISEEFVRKGSSLLSGGRIVDAFHDEAQSP